MTDPWVFAPIFWTPHTQTVPKVPKAILPRCCWFRSCNWVFPRSRSENRTPTHTQTRIFKYCKSLNTVNIFLYASPSLTGRDHMSRRIFFCLPLCNHRNDSSWRPMTVRCQSADVAGCFLATATKRVSFVHPRRCLLTVFCQVDAKKKTTKLTTRFWGGKIHSQRNKVAMRDALFKLSTCQTSTFLQLPPSSHSWLQWTFQGSWDFCSKSRLPVEVCKWFPDLKYLCLRVSVAGLALPTSNLVSRHCSLRTAEYESGRIIYFLTFVQLQSPEEVPKCDKDWIKSGSDIWLKALGGDGATWCLLTSSQHGPKVHSTQYLVSNLM